MYKIKESRKFRYKEYPEKVSDDLTVFQSAQLQKNYSKNVLFYAIQKRMRYRVFEVYDEDRLVLIFPAYVGDNIVELAGNNSGISTLSPVFFQSTSEYFEETFDFLLTNMNYYQFSFGRVIENSRFASYLESLKKYSICKEIVQNVKIMFDKGYEYWFSSLRKSVKQNLRTAYNRIMKDGLEYEIQFYNGGEIPKELLENLVDIYNRRHSEHYGVKTSILKKFYMQHLDFSTRDLYKNHDARHCVLYIDHKIAAFYSGYYDIATNSVVIPRLSIDTNFSRYSPGYVLLNEAIKYFSTNNLINCIDLTTGTEKYKMDLGGMVYNRINFNLTRNK